MYSFAQARFSPATIDLSAFSNFASNIQDISKPAAAVETKLGDEAQITEDIIKVVDKEISKNIKTTRYALVPRKPKLEKTIIAKVQPKPVAPVEVVSQDFSEYEINNKELIELYAFEVEKYEYSTFANIELASTYYNEEVNDEVAVQVASTANAKVAISESAPIEADEVKTIQPAPQKDESNIKEEDLVMFEYSDKVAESTEVKNIDQKLYERPLSSAVKKAISREIGSAPIKKLVTETTQPKQVTPEKITIEDTEVDLNSEDTIVYDYSSEKTSKALTAANESEAFTAPAEVTTHETQFIIRAKELNLSTQKLSQLHGFEFVPDYDRAERISDSATGEINLAYSLTGKMNTQTGVVQSQGIIPTRVELALGSMKGLEVPLINEAGIQKFLQKQGLSIEGNLLMIALNSNISDAEIDSSFGAKFIFDKNFRPVQQMNGASFVLFAGVKSGNVLIKYLLSNKESAQKIVYVGDGELYFEDPSFIASERETYTFTTRNILGNKKKELSIDGSAITFFNTNTTAKKKALNAYEIKTPVTVTGMRKYLEFKHLKDSIFVGLSEDKDVEIPGNDFISKVLEMNQINSLRERCVVQVNLTKDVRAITANGKNRSGEMFVETSYLDRDGNFSRDNFELADKAFIVGDMEGQFSVKLDYTDGSSEFLKTFCSEGTYLVEQL